MRTIISLDFETLYGTWDVNSEEYIEVNIKNAYEALDRIIDIHESMKIKLNVAIVGLLLPNISFDDFKEVFYREREEKQEILEKYVSIENFKDLFKCPVHLLEKMLNSPYVELISHTICHNYFNKLTDQDLIKEFQGVESSVGSYGMKRGIIFPKNIVDPHRLEKLNLYNEYSLRVNYVNDLYNVNKYNFLVRLLRFADSFLLLNEFVGLGKVTNPEKHSLKLTYGSVFFRPEFSFKVLDVLHRNRIKRSIQSCLSRGEDFHLWSHPHNFGKNVKISLQNYRKVLQLLQNSRSIFFSEL